MPIALLNRNPPLVTQEFRYDMPEASEVFLLWGIDGWQVVPEEMRPVGTTVKEVMQTPMERKDDTFIATEQVPVGAAVDYGFLITKKRNGINIKPVWDGSSSYKLIAKQASSIEVKATLTLAQSQEITSEFEVGLYLLVAIGIVFGFGVALKHIPDSDNPRNYLCVNWPSINRFDAAPMASLG